MGNFNWVHARANCSLEGVFHILSEIVDSDVKQANALRRQGVKFSLNTEATSKIMVIRDRDLGGTKETTGVIFELLPDTISVTRKKHGALTEDSLFSAVPSLNEDGECLMEVKGKPLKLWQMSRKALENLFFGF
jgi:hypothetical protein